MQTIIAAYGELLQEVDRWFADCLGRHPAEIACTNGCSACCCSLFDITLLDAWNLKRGFDRLPATVRGQVRARATARLAEIQLLWPEFSEPFLLNLRPEEEWSSLMSDEDETPCPLLADNGSCLVYEARPMTCRLHGLPLIDVSGEVMHDEWCTMNLTGCADPLALPGLAGEFDRILRDEVRLGRRFSQQLLGEVVHELDTFIPMALLVDFAEFDWKGWWQRHRSTIFRLQQP
jgi:Fe-S-cluster containining protein